MNISQFNRTPYSFEFPIPALCMKCTDEHYATIEDCIAACKAACMKWGVDYNWRDVKLFMTDRDGKWEVTEEGELAG